MLAEEFRRIFVKWDQLEYHIHKISLSKHAAANATKATTATSTDIVPMRKSSIGLLSTSYGFLFSLDSQEFLRLCSQTVMSSGDQT